MQELLVVKRARYLDLSFAFYREKESYEVTMFSFELANGSRTVARFYFLRFF